MKKVLLIALMAMVCHNSFAQDSDSTGGQKDQEGKSTLFSINSQGKDGKSKTTKLKVDLIHDSKNAYFGIDPSLEFGWNRFMDNGSLTIGSSNKDLRLDKGPEFAFFPITGGVYLDRKHSVKISTGLGIIWNTYHFEKDITLLKGQDALKYNLEEDKHFSKNLLRSKYLTMPLMFSVYPIKDSRFQINAGVEGGLFIGAKTKQISESEGKQKVKGSFNLNPVRYGLRFGLGFDTFNLYAKYYFSDVFAPNEGPKDFRTVSIGISIGFF